MDERCEKALAYILEHTIWLVISMTFYQAIIFCKIGTCSNLMSQLILCGLVAFFCFVGGMYDLSYQMRKMGIFCNLFLGYGIYTCIAYYFAFSKYIVVVSVSTLALTLLSLLALFFKRSSKYLNARDLRKRKLHLSIYACRRNFAYAMFMVMLSVSVRIVFTNSVASASLEVMNSYGEDYNFENNAQMISKIRPEIWEHLSFQEKIDVAQAIAHCEANYLGLPDKVVVVAKDLDEYVLGNYEDYTYRISIDTEHLQYSMAEDVVRTILHEVYHCYQRRCVEVYKKLEPEERNLMMFYRTADYAQNFNNYIDGTKDFDGYSEQALEIDAREYAMQNVEVYYSLIEEAVLEGKIQ